MRDYTELTYRDEPLTAYPAKLARYILRRFNVPVGARILDVGCGMGDYTVAFAGAYTTAHGVDECDYWKQRFPELTVFAAIPYFSDAAVGGYDLVFSKSFFEHVYHPETYAAQMFDATKPGGLCVAMTPDWRACYRGFYGDCQHRSPFTPFSLAELLEWAGYSDCGYEDFWQVPAAWIHPWLLWPMRVASWFGIGGGVKERGWVFAQRGYRMALAWGRKK